MVLMGIAGFRERSFRDDDPLICACGQTIGTKRLEKHEDVLEQVLADHEPEHQRRLALQAAARGYAAPAVPPEEDDDADII